MATITMMAQQQQYPNARRRREQAGILARLAVDQSVRSASRGGAFAVSDAAMRKVSVEVGMAM
jgi:hypothetical protein